MIDVPDTFPDLVEALSEALRVEGEQDLLAQIQNAVATKVTFDSSVDAAYLYLEPTKKLNVVEENVMDMRISKTTEVKTPFWTILDIDNFGRVVGIEILDPGSLRKSIREHASI